MAAAPPSRARSGSVGAKHYRSLPLLLGLLVALVLGALAFELSFVTPDASGTAPEEYQDVLHVLDAAAAAEDTEKAPPADADAFYPDAVFKTDWSQKIKESDILHEAALHRGCVRHKNSVVSWEFGRTEQDEKQDLLQLVNESDPRLLEKLRQCPDVDVFLPEGLRSFGYCEDAVAYTNCTSLVMFSFSFLIVVFFYVYFIFGCLFYFWIMSLKFYSRGCCHDGYWSTSLKTPRGTAQ